MSENLERIEKALAQITATLERQSKDILELRDDFKKIAQASKPSSTDVVIDPECGYEWIGLHLQLDSNTWARIKSGEEVLLKGRGWVPDQNVKPNPADKNFYWDYWEFSGGIDRPMRVEMVSHHDNTLDVDECTAYEGPLLKRFVHQL